MNDETNNDQMDNEELKAEESTSAEETETNSNPKMKWYIAKTLTGQENKVARAIKERVTNASMTDFFGDILVPEETVVSNVNGKKRTIKKKFFPGYVLINMEMTENTWHLVKDTDKVTGFVGGTVDAPAPLTDAEARSMLGQVEDGFKKPRSTVDFSEGETVKVIEGPFATFTGQVEAVNEKGKLKVNISVFGRPTPVELDASQVEKIS